MRALFLQLVDALRGAAEADASALLCALLPLLSSLCVAGGRAALLRSAGALSALCACLAAAMHHAQMRSPLRAMLTSLLFAPEDLSAAESVDTDARVEAHTQHGVYGACARAQRYPSDKTAEARARMHVALAFGLQSTQTAFAALGPSERARADDDAVAACLLERQQMRSLLLTLNAAGRRRNLAPQCSPGRASADTTQSTQRF
eukprot:2104300-Pleurochrysis_carterae.AAC.5